MKANTTINTDGITHLRKENYGAAFAAEMRAELKRRGAKGVSIRRNRGGYTDSFTVTVKMAPEDYSTVTEAAEIYGMGEFLRDWDRRGVYIGDRWYNRGEWEGRTNDELERLRRQYLAQSITRAREFYGQRCHERDYHWEYSQRGYERLKAIYQIINQWNWDKSDPMTDYFDVGYYLYINVQPPEGFTAVQ